MRELIQGLESLRKEEVNEHFKYVVVLPLCWTELLNKCVHTATLV